MTGPTGPLPIADYALIGDGAAAALVGRSGAIDWLCWPRFDSPACLAALLGTPAHGQWVLAPAAIPHRIARRYLDGTLVLETLFETADGAVAVIDLMPLALDGSALLRRVEGRAGAVALRMQLAPRFGNGFTVPWLRRRADGGVAFIGGPDGLVLHASVQLDTVSDAVEARVVVAAGESAWFVLRPEPSAHAPPAPSQPLAWQQDTVAAWQGWSGRATCRGPYRAAMVRSLITLKALTDRRTGAMIAAPTTSLPEHPGGTRNWDYRYCWLRDSAWGMQALVRAGYRDEALAWRGWLYRAVGADPWRLRIMYGVAGEPHLPEWQADWLPGYQGARPVRLGNAAHDQLQIDVFGELLDTLAALGTPDESWELVLRLIARLQQVWMLPDDGMWETRGGRRRFTVSAVMAWVAVDRAIAIAERCDAPAPLAAWRELRACIHATVCREGFDAARGCFTQSFGAPDLDAATLLIPLVGFLPPDDPRVRGTVAAIEADLLQNGLVLRYRTERGADGLPPGEGVFLACSFWLVACYAHLGRRGEAVALFERLLALGNDVGLFAEELDPVSGRHLGNFPQGFSHFALLGAAWALDETAG